MNRKELEKERAKEEAQKFIKPLIKKKTKLLIVIKSVSSSGMTRRMKVAVDGQDISYYVADLCDLSINENGLKIGGCGMDMTFWLANAITNCLYGYDKKPKWLTGNGGSCIEWQVL